MKKNTIKIEVPNDREIENYECWNVNITCADEDTHRKVENQIIEAGLGESLGCPWDETDYDDGYGDTIAIDRNAVDSKGDWIKEIRKEIKKIKKQL